MPLVQFSGTASDGADSGNLVKYDLNPKFKDLDAGSVKSSDYFVVQSGTGDLSVILGEAPLELEEDG